MGVFLCGNSLIPQQEGRAKQFPLTEHMVGDIHSNGVKAGVQAVYTKKRNSYTSMSKAMDGIIAYHILML